MLPSSVPTDRIEDLVARATRDVDEGRIPSCQLAVGLDGEVVVEETIGDPDGRRYVVFSVSKAVMAGAMWLLIGDGLLRPEDKVVDHLPEFGTNGKDVITVEQLLTMEAGIPQAPLGPPEWHDRAARRRRFAEWRLNWDPGLRVEYHPTSAHWVLGELIEAVTGIDHRRFVTDRICAPLGLEHLRLGVPAEEQGDIVDVELVGTPPTAEELEAVTGISGIDLSEMDLGEITDDTLLRFNDVETRELGQPAGGVISTAGDMARYLQALLHDPAGLWDPEVLADGTGRVRTTKVDVMIGVPANRSLGLNIAGDDGHALRRGMGKTTSPQAFGHHGVGGQIAWADPASGLSFCYLTNGLEANPIEDGRRRASLSNRAGALLD
ncbi:MAG: serine hydrolase domain-containing protein [Actinomycetota bacterium]